MTLPEEPRQCNGGKIRTVQTAESQWFGPGPSNLSGSLLFYYKLPLGNGGGITFNVYLGYNIFLVHFDRLNLFVCNFQ